MSENAFPDALAPGYRLHWYVLEQVLGQGGFGITYLARDTNLDQPVAVKEYLPAEVAGRRGDSSVRARTEEHDERYRWVWTGSSARRAPWRASTIRTSCACCRCSSPTTRHTW